MQSIKDWFEKSGLAKTKKTDVSEDQLTSNSTSNNYSFSALPLIINQGTSEKKEITPDKKRDELLIDVPLIKKQKTSEKKMNPTKILDFAKIVNLKVDSRHQKIKCSNEPQTMPLMISIFTPDTELGKQRVGLDIIIVIDCSGSMDGEKIKLVVDTLLFIIDEMQDTDRLSLIGFNTFSEILTKLTPMTVEAKQKFKNVVLEKIEVRNDTNINLGLKDAYDVMLNRKEINDVTAVFLLSDGQDTCGNSLPDFEETLKTYDNKMTEKGMSYKINSFGYGEQHDETVLGLISNFKEGSFYYIKSLKLLDECFIDCLGYLMSVFGSQAEVFLYMSDKNVLVKKYGSNWAVEDNASRSTLKIGNIAAGMEKNYIVEIQVQATEDLKDIKVCRAVLNFVAEGQVYTLRTELILPVVNDQDLGIQNEKFEQHLVRVQAAQTLKSAEEDYKKGNVEMAKSKIADFKNRVSANAMISKHESEKLDELFNDDIFEDNKNLVENYDILEKQAYRPSKANYSQSNKVQKEMLSRKQQ